jgi:hypothetical protein
MEVQTVNPLLTDIEKPFIVANTLPVSMRELREEHIIPVFTKDNHPLISQSQIIELTGDVLSNFPDFKLSEPQIRVSHPVKGRIPEAKNKKAIDLLPNESTLYYERMMFLIQVPNIKSTVNDQELSLVIGGIKSYSWDNLSKDYRANQQFKFFIGFQVFVCSNLCVSTDGVVLNFKTTSLSLIGQQIKLMVESYSPDNHLKWLECLDNYSLTEPQFAHFIGRCRMYQHLPDKAEIPELMITDSQISSVVKGYYSDPYFSSTGGEIGLWNLYNLITDSNKSSYIDGFLDRGVNAEQISNELIRGLERNQSWFL